MTADERAVRTLRGLADDDGQIRTNHLPAPVTDRLQWVVDHCVHRCVHLALADDLPPAAIPKLCLQSVPIIVCAGNPICTVEMVQLVKSWRGLSLDTSCSLCGRLQTTHRIAWTDESVALTMIGFVCATCTGRLAALVGEPR